MPEYCNFKIFDQIPAKLMRKDGKTRISVILVLTLAVISGCARDNGEPGFAGIVADSLAKVFVPDRRTGIWEIKTREGEDNSIILYGESTVTGCGKLISDALGKFHKKIIDSILYLPDTSNKRYSGLVTLSVATMRKEPAESAELVSQALLGTPVIILKEEDSWLLIRTPDNYIGWVDPEAIEPMTVAGMASWRNSPRVIWTGEPGYIRSGPDSRDIVSDILPGCILVAGKEERGMAEVQLPDGRRGYVSRLSVKDFRSWERSAESTEGDIVSCAGRFMGLPYLWGGTSAKAVDCSGFSKSVYFMNGIILQRDASQQALHGISIDISAGFDKLRPGDLLFFGTVKPTGMRVTHVAIYIGDGNYIHASGRVKISSLYPSGPDYSEERRKALLLARRIIGAEKDPGIVKVADHPLY